MTYDCFMWNGEQDMLEIRFSILNKHEPRAFETAFDRAAYQKDSIREALEGCSPNDWIYYSDVDEVWKPQKKEGKLRQLNYSYYLNNRSSEVWEGTNVFKYKNIGDLNTIRADHRVILDNGGWHFTNLMNHSELIRKIESYDHQEVNIPWVKNGLQARMDANVDYLGRTHDWQGKPFVLWKDDSQLPKYILDNKERYSHLWKQ